MFKNLLTYPSGIAQAQNFVLTKHLQPAGTEFPLHWHDYIEFEIILSGTGLHNYNGTSYGIAPGSAYLMSHYDFHGFTALTDITLYNIHFNQSAVHPDLLPHLDIHSFCCQFDQQEQELIFQMLHRLEEETTETKLFSQMIQQNILSEILILMMRKSTKKSSLAAPSPILQSIAYINEHFQHRLTLQELADTLSFSPNYLGHLFKQQTGKTFQDYVNIVRLKYACRLLSATTLTIKEIAFASGYQSPEYFIYAFKKKMFMTPGEYRNHTKKIIV